MNAIDIKLNTASRRAALRRTLLAVAITASVGMTGQVMAQATTGTIFGSAPAGQAVQVTGGSGFNRTVPVDATGHYSVVVPVGAYTVNLMQSGAVVLSHDNVSPNAGGSAEADFSAAEADNGKTARNLSTVSVTANTLPSIDVSSTSQNLTITAKQLSQLPLARSAAAIALLAPGTTPGAAMLGGGPTGEAVLSFGGSTIVENAYYINGFDTSDPLSNTGGITLPYGSIDQQQTLTSGYGAQYGRSTGGVISQVGKSGTNDWHFGGQVLWQPAFAQSDYVNTNYSNPRANNFGSLYSYRQADSDWNTVYDAYIGGPLIKDKLFMFVSAEADKSQFTRAGSVSAANISQNKNSAPKVYAKLDWNINDNNILSLTGLKNSLSTAANEVYGYDSTTHQTSDFQSLGQQTKNAFGIWIAKYTSYITDDLTLNVLYGKMNATYYTYQPTYPGFDPTVPNVLGSSSENPAYLVDGVPRISSNLNTNQANPAHTSEVRNLRLDLDWKLGDHDLQFGIDNSDASDNNDGQLMTGPGYAWDYGNTDTPGTPIQQGQYNVDAPGGYPGGTCTIQTSTGPAQAGCYVSQYRFVTSASVQVKQRAEYVQDNWQVTPNFLLNIGLRDDQFTNYNPSGQAFLRLTKPQWAPRIGFSWDVMGDSTLKVFGNIGRYYVAMPSAVALRSAGDPLYTQTYFTYTGIDANGLPTGLTPVGTDAPGGAVPVNGEDGSAIPPRQVAAQGIKAEYQDQLVLGMQQQIAPSWVYGVTGTVNKIGNIIDDIYASAGTSLGYPGPAQEIVAAAAAQGITIDPANLSGSVLINPGRDNTLQIRNDAGGYDLVKVTPATFGFPKVKRNYYSLDMYLEHAFDGKWFGKIDYVFSRSYGTTEGPVQSSIGQGGSSQSATEQWDYGQLMENANGVQPNDQKHQLRIYGSYQITPEWMLGATYRIASGTPESCLGLYGPAQINLQGYGNSFHYCGGLPTPPGTTGFTPWTHQLNLQVDYRPAFAAHKLDFDLQVHNVFNEQNVTQIFPSYGTTNAPNVNYLLPQGYEAPRYVSIGVMYDY